MSSVIDHHRRGSTQSMTEIRHMPAASSLYVWTSQVWIYEHYSKYYSRGRMRKKRRESETEANGRDVRKGWENMDEGESWEAHGRGGR